MSAEKKTDYSNLAKYSGMVFQMGATIALGVWGGMKLDQYFPIAKFPAFTVILSLGSVFAAMYWVIRGVMKK